MLHSEPYVREAAPSDAPRIAELAQEVQTLHAAALPATFKPANADTFPPDVIRERMATPDHRFWVAVDGDDVVGYVYATVQLDPESPWRYATTIVMLDQMCVTARCRRRGVGRALVNAVHALAADVGAREVRLNVWTFNEAARAFYRRCGFEPMHERLWLPVR